MLFYIVVDPCLSVRNHDFKTTPAPWMNWWEIFPFYTFIKSDKFVIQYLIESEDIHHMHQAGMTADNIENLH